MKVAIFSLLISISVALLSIFQFERYQNFTLNTQTKLGNLESKLGSGLENMQTEIIKTNKQAETISTLQSEISNSNKMPQLELAEAKYLTLLAEMRLQTDRDVKSAIILLTSALDKIQKLGESYNPLRTSLNTDLSILHNLNLPNTEELWLKVSTIIELSGKIKLGAELSNNQTSTINATPQNSETLPRWKQSLLKSWQELKDLIKIRHYAKPIEPVLLETEQIMIRENLRLLLEQIRLAILRKENKIYHQALQETELWLEKYFDGQDLSVKEIQTILLSLKDINLNFEIPSLTSLTQFNAEGS